MYSACEVRACAESKMDTAVLTSFLPSSSFSCLIFFYLAGHLVGFFILVGTVFRKTFRIVGLGGRETRRFSWKFSGQCYMPVFAFFSSPWLNCAHWFWYRLKDLFTPHKFFTDKVALARSNWWRHKRYRKDLDPNGRLRVVQGRMGSNGVEWDQEWDTVLGNFTRGVLLRILALVGVCRPVVQILTLFQIKTCNFPHPFSDQTSKILIPVFIPGL